MTQARLQGRQTQITHVYMWTGARHMLELAEASEVGRIYTATASLLFSAFTLEAYFNHLGRALFADWERIERTLSKKQKFSRLAERSFLPVLEQERPQLTMGDLFRFRDRLAHGRDVHESIDRDIEWIGMAVPHFGSESEWQAFATPERAREAIGDVEAIVRRLYHGCQQAHDPFASGGSGVFGITRVRGNGDGADEAGHGGAGETPPRAPAA